MSTVIIDVDVDVREKTAPEAAHAIADRIERESAIWALIGYVIDPLSIKVQRGEIFGTDEVLTITMRGARS